MATTFKTAVDAAAADVSPLRVLTTGDSLVEGAGASTFANTWRQRLAGLLRSTYGIKGAGLGYIPARPYATYLAADASWRNPGTSGTATTAPNWNITPGLKGVRFTAAGQTRQIVLPDGTAFDFMYLQAAGVGGGVLNVQLNGGTATAVNTNDTGQTYQPSKLLRITRPGGRGAMTVLTTAASAAGGVHDGVMHYDGDDVGGGVHMFDCSRTGARSDVITTDDMLNGWTAWQPHVIFDDQVGTNDFLDGAAAAPNTGADPATVASRLGLRLDKAQAMASQPTYVVKIPWRVAPLQATIAGRTYQQYIDAVLATIAAHPYAANVKVFDLQAVYPTAATEPWHNADGLHPNDTGHQKIAEAAMAFLVSMDVVVRTASGTLALSGGATASVAFARTASGAVTLAGTATGTASGGTLTRTAAGTIGLTGAATASTSGGTVTRTATGTLSIEGTASATISGGTLTRTAVAILVLSGFADPAGGVIARTATGNLGLAGTATATTEGGTLARTATGTVLLAGTASATTEGGTLARTASGAIALAGTASATAVGGTVARIASAVLTLSGIGQRSSPPGAVDYEIVSIVERPTRTITIQGDPMDLDRNARRYYRPEVTTKPTGLPADQWEASFDGGTTWHDAIDMEGMPAWLVAGPDAEMGTAVARITMRTRPRVRIIAGAEIEAERTPYINVA